MDEDGYPEEEVLKKKREWDIVKDGYNDLIQLIRENWKFEGFGYFVLKGKNLELHTGGWSGNEDIIDALKHNLFWSVFWMKTERGGHYYFELQELNKEISNSAQH